MMRLLWGDSCFNPSCSEFQVLAKTGNRVDGSQFARICCGSSEKIRIGRLGNGPVCDASWQEDLKSSSSLPVVSRTDSLQSSALIQAASSGGSEDTVPFPVRSCCPHLPRSLCMPRRV